MGEVLQAGAHRGGQVERVVGEVLVDVEHHVGIGLRGVAVGLQVGALRRVLGQHREGRGVHLALVGLHVLVVLHAARDVEPVGDFELERGAEQEAVLGRRVHVAVGNPPGVLHRQTVVAQRPVHRLDVAAHVVALVVLVLVDVVTAREEVNRHQRVGVLTLREHVLLLDFRVHGVQVEGHAAVEELRGVAGGEGVAVEVVVLDDTSGVDRTGRNVGLVLLVARREAHRVGDVVARLEEVVDAVVGRRAHLLGVPAVPLARLRTVGVLEAGQHEGRVEGRVVAVGDRGVVGRALLRGDDDHAVGGSRTVERRGGRAVEDRYRLDVVGVDGRHGVTGLTGAGVLVVGLGRRGVRQRNTVDHVEGVVVARDGLRTTHHHAGAAADTGRTGVNLHAGNLAGEAVHDVGVLGLDQLLAVALLDVVRERLGLAAQTESRNDHLADGGCILLEGDVNLAARAHGDRRGLVADEAD